MTIYYIYLFYYPFLFIYCCHLFFSVFIISLYIHENYKLRIGYHIFLISKKNFFFQKIKRKNCHFDS